MMPTNNNPAEAIRSCRREGDELVIRIGINRLNGHEGHPMFCPFDFEDRNEWIDDVISQLTKEEEDGTTPLDLLFDEAMKQAIEYGSLGIASDSPLGWTNDNKPTRDDLYSWI